MWSKNGSPVSLELFAAPSRFSDTVTSVSFVFRVTLAVRLMRGPP